MSLITLDFETYYDKEYSLKKLTTEEYTRDPRFEVIGFAYSIDGDRPTWVTGIDKEISEALHELGIQTYQLLAHNTAFDGAILKWRYGIQPKFYFDTLSMSRPVTGLTVGGSLATLAKRFLRMEKGTEVQDAVGKHRDDFTPAELAAYGQYCCNDVTLTWNLFQKMQQYTTPKELALIDILLRMFIDPVLELDEGILREHLSSVRERKGQLLQTVQSLLGVESEEEMLKQLMSNDKLAALLESFGVEPPTKVSPKTGKVAYAFAKTDDAFKELLEHDDERVQAVVSARLGVKSTLEETRTESFLGIASRGALPIPLNYWGAHTGRASGADGINLQNLPRGGQLRYAMKAPKGHVVVAADAAQIEARVLAWLAGQEDLVEDFRNKVDIYSKFATKAYGRPIDRKRKAIDANGEEYYPDFSEGFAGKTAILGLGFGTGAKRLKKELKDKGGLVLELDWVQTNLIDTYRKMYTDIVAFWGECTKALVAMVRGDEYELSHLKMLCTDTGILLPSGMYIRYPNLRKENGQYLYDNRKKPTNIHGAKLTENVVQALARIITFGHMGKVDQHLRQLDTPTSRYRTVLTVHDEVVTVVPEQAARETLSFMVDVMSKPPAWAAGLPLAAEGKIGKSYGECK